LTNVNPGVWLNTFITVQEELIRGTPVTTSREDVVASSVERANVNVVTLEQMIQASMDRHRKSKGDQGKKGHRDTVGSHVEGSQV
jgi:hypothetical protein